MAQYKGNITLYADDPTEAQAYFNLLQNAVSSVSKEDMLQLLSAVKKNPAMVKKALPFLKLA
jgi:hypothetical protein